jgi:Zn-dependent metalloprotease
MTNRLYIVSKLLLLMIPLLTITCCGTAVTPPVTEGPHPTEIPLNTEIPPIMEDNTLPTYNEFSLLERVLQTPVGNDLSDIQKAGFERLIDVVGKRPIYLNINSRTIEPTWIKLSLPVKSEDPLVNAEQFLADYGDIFKINDLGYLNQIGKQSVGDCCTLVYYAQFYDGYPVYGAGLSIVEDNKKGLIVYIQSSLLPRISYKKVDSAVLDSTLGEASELLNEEIEPKLFDKDMGGLTILDSRLFDYGPATAKLTWHFAYPSDDGGQLTHLFVDAEKGGLITSMKSNPLILDSNTDVLLASTQISTPIYHINPETGIPDYISWAHLGGYKPDKDMTKIEDYIYSFLETHPDLFSDANPRRHQRIEKTIDLDAFGFTIVQTRQYYGDLPVFGAGYRYLIAPDRRLWSIHGNYIPNLTIDTEPHTLISPEEAVSIIAESRAKNKCQYCTADEIKVLVTIEREKIIEPTLGIFPKTLSLAPPLNQNTSGSNDIEPTKAFFGILVYKVVTDTDIFYIDASNGSAIHSYTLIMTDDEPGEVKVYDANGDVSDHYGVYVTEENLGNPDQNQDVQDVNEFASYVLNFWYNREDLFPYSNLDDYMSNDGEYEYLIVNANITDQNAAAYHTIDSEKEINVFRPNVIDSDIVTHEMTHGVTWNSSNFHYADESGALSESYSCVFSELIFKDPFPNWLYRNSRDLANPTINHMARYHYPPSSCVGKYSDPACAGVDYGYVHENSSIPSLAAVFISDGVPAYQPGTNDIPGIGRDKLAALSFMTLTQILEEWSGFTDAMMGTYQACTLWRGYGWENNFTPPLSQADCDVIVNAWARVGIDPNTSVGWVHVPDQHDSDFEEGGTMYNPDSGCKVAGCILKLTDLGQYDGMHLVCTSKDICPYQEDEYIGNTLDYSNGEYSATMNCKSITDLTIPDTVTSASVHINNSNSKDLSYLLEFVPDIPNNLSIDYCFGTVITRDSTVMKHWSKFFDGGKGDELVGPPSDMPPGCTVTGVSIQKINENGSVMETGVTTVGNDDSGARIMDTTNNAAPILGTNKRQLKVHWWFNAFNIIRYRIEYKIATTENAICWPER